MMRERLYNRPLPLVSFFPKESRSSNLSTTILDTQKFIIILGHLHALTHSISLIEHMIYVHITQTVTIIHSHTHTNQCTQQWLEGAA